MMQPQFNLISEPWVPCIRQDGKRVYLGLRDVFAQAKQLRSISDSSPLVSVAILRLLLAIIHRTHLGPKNAKAWGELWKNGLDLQCLLTHFDKHHDRFFLFHPKHPFFQDSSIAENECTSSANKLSFELASGANATLFDHSTDDGDTWLDAGAAARWLVARQQFSVGGLESHQSQTKASLLVKAVVFSLQGENLRDTLVLNLHRYNGKEGDPFQFDETKDLAAWERPAPCPTARVPDGYVDWLTWQSRCVRLWPSEQQGKLGTSRVCIMKGHSLPDEVTRRGRETMVAFCKSTSPKARKAREPWPPLGFQHERALWRDSAAFLERTDANERPRILSWLADLAAEDKFNSAIHLPLLAQGVATDQAKVEFWRQERLSLPMKFLQIRELGHAVNEALEFANDAGSKIECGLRDVAAQITSTKPFDKLSDEGKNVAKSLIEHLQPTSGYWTQLEVPFRALLQDLPNDEANEDGVRVFRGQAMAAWKKAVIQAAKEAFDKCCDSLGTSARVLAAAAVSQLRFSRCVNSLNSKTENVNVES